MNNWINNIRRINNHQQVRQGLRKIASFLDRLAGGVLRMMAISLFLKLASYFCPELPEKIPIIYEFCDGFLQFGEFAIRAALGGLYAFFTGNFTEFWQNYGEAVNELLKQFIRWLATISF